MIGLAYTMEAQVARLNMGQRDMKLQWGADGQSVLRLGGESLIVKPPRKLPQLHY